MMAVDDEKNSCGEQQNELVQRATLIKKFAQILKENYNSDPPEELKELLTLPGIGPKMAHIYLQCCCDKIEGIAVDTHVHRICNRLKWVNETKTPEHTRKGLESWLPKELWSDINLVLVGFGQTICSAVAPKCSQCKLNRDCDFGIERLKKLNEKKTSKSRSKSKSKIISEKLNEEEQDQITTPKKSLKRTLDDVNINQNSNKSNKRKK